MIFNTGETASALKAEYNPEGSLLRQVQIRLLDMMLYLDSVCKKIKVDYRIDGGNVLGAVRHGGFIPWDDDVDVVIENSDDYKRLCEYLVANPHPQYVLQNDVTDDGCIKSWSILRDTKSEYIHNIAGNDKLDRMGKYRGLQIDIFPYEAGAVPFLHQICALSYKVEKKVIVRNKSLARFIHKLQKSILRPVLRFFGKYVGDRDIYMHAYGNGFNYSLDKAILLPHKPIEFEGYLFPGPADPISLLKVFYGDYMNLPPKECRVHHDVKYKIW